MTRTRLPLIGAFLSLFLIAAPASAITPESASIDAAWRLSASESDSDRVMCSRIAPPLVAKAGACSMMVETHCWPPADGINGYWPVSEAFMTRAMYRPTPSFLIG